MATASKIVVKGIKYDIRDDYIREEIEKLQDPVSAGEGIEISEDGVVSIKEEEQ